MESIRRHSKSHVLFFIVWSSLTVFAVPTYPEIQATLLKFDEETHDFGVHPQKDAFTYAFPFKNVSDRLVTIKSITTSCGCTLVLPSTQTVKPRGHGELFVHFDTGQLAGDIEADISIEIGSPEPRVQHLHASFCVVPEFTFSRAEFDFGVIQRESIKPQILIVTPIRAKGIVIRKVYSVPDELNIVCATQKDGSIRINAIPRYPLAQGDHHGAVVLETNNVVWPLMKLPMRFVVVGPYIVDPPHFLFGFVEPGRKISRQVLVSKRGDPQFGIRKVVSENKTLKVRFAKAPHNSNSYQVIATSLDEAENSNLLSAESVLVYVQGQEGPALRIPVLAMLRNRMPDPPIPGEAEPVPLDVAGIVLLAHLSAWQGHPLSDEAVLQLVRKYPARNPSPQTLVEAAAQLGISLRSVRVSLRDLSTLNRYCIVQERHSFIFGILLDVLKDRVRVREGNMIKVYSFDAYSKRFSENVLVNNVPETNGPRMVIDESDFVFYARYPGQVIEHEFTIRNVGSAALSFADSTTSCGCVAAKMDGAVIRPSETGRVRVTVRATPDSGLGQSVILNSNDPIKPKVALTIRGVLLPQDR